MIVTHEMNFARAISNRVFYMDEGGIYEDGSPEQIFDNPTRENTIRFIRKLKIHEIAIASRDFDYLGAAAGIVEFGNKNQIPPRKVTAIYSVFEELCQQILAPVLEDPDIRFEIEYSEETEQVHATVRYLGDRFDPADTEDELAYRVLRSRCETFEYEYVSGEWPNTINIEL